MQVKDILSEIENFAPLAYQENYDNCGVQVGDINIECTGVLLTLDVTEGVLDEAIILKTNLIIAHHPLIFSGIKKLTGKNSVERIVIKAIQHNITIYAAHTNMDNVQMGVNNKIADKLGLINRKILQPQRNHLLKLYTYVPKANAEKLANELYKVGAGIIGNYSECSFSTEGVGTFKPLEKSNPHIGNAGGKRESVDEVKMEFILPDYLQNVILSTLRLHHPYEEVAYEIIRLENANQTIGAGMIGDLKESISIEDFFKNLKSSMELTAFKYTNIHKKKIQRIALCGGSGSFLLPDALRQNADIFITADFKYHQFFDAENKIIIADIGHYESEHYTQEIFSEIINEKFPNFAIHFTTINTNPVNYYI